MAWKLAKDNKKISHTCGRACMCVSHISIKNPIYYPYMIFWTAWFLKTSVMYVEPWSVFSMTNIVSFLFRFHNYNTILVKLPRKMIMMCVRAHVRVCVRARVCGTFPLRSPVIIFKWSSTLHGFRRCQSRSLVLNHQMCSL